jgi:hypothetical protein
MTRAKTPRVGKKSNIEIRNSKQIQMTKNTKFQISLIRIHRFGISRVLDLFGLLDCFGFRASNFGF